VFLTSDSPRAERSVKAALQKLGHEVEGPTALGAGALLDVESFPPGALVAVLWSKSSNRRSTAVLVEIGIAIGRHIPVLLVTKPGVALPALQGIPRVLASDGEDELLDVQIDLFLQGAARNRPKGPAPKADIGQPVAPALLATRGRRLEEVIGDLFRSTGQELLKSSSMADDRADFTLYFGPENGDLGVVLVEVKEWSQRVPREGLRQAALRLSDQVVLAGAGLGVLIYNGPTVSFTGAPLVAAVSFDDLSGELHQRTLVEVLRRARNESIHGR
jgi:hypothetical protein